jgi:hypothetical protein
MFSCNPDLQRLTRKGWRNARNMLWITSGNCRITDELKFLPSGGTSCGKETRPLRLWILLIVHTIEYQEAFAQSLRTCWPELKSIIDSHAGWGVILRDFHREVIAATTERSGHVADEFHAELTVVQSSGPRWAAGSYQIMSQKSNKACAFPQNKKRTLPGKLLINKCKFKHPDSNVICLGYKLSTNRMHTRAYHRLNGTWAHNAEKGAHTINMLAWKA